MLSKRLLCQMLNVKNTIIDDFCFLEQQDSLIIYVHPTKGQQCRCGKCGRKAPYYDGKDEVRLWRGLDLGLHKTYLAAYPYRVKCPEHGVTTASVPWANLGSRFTRDFENVVAWLAVNCSKKAVSGLMRISWNSVGPIISRVRKELDPHPEDRFNNLRCIGIDETSYRKGHTYITVVVNHDTGNVIWVGEGHDYETLSAFFELLTPEQRASIELVSADGAKWIANCVRDYCPNAERCMDIFHVVEWANEALSQIRIDSWHEARKNVQKRNPGRPAKDSEPVEDIASAIKGSKYALGKNPENLTVNQMAKLEQIAITNPKLWRGYKLKEGLRCVFKMDFEEGTKELDKWLGWARRCRIPAFVELGRKIKRHYEAILKTMECGLSNAMNEAVNNKIKLTIRMAYGFRDIAAMIDMIMLRCSNIKVPFPWLKGGCCATLD